MKQGCKRTIVLKDVKSHTYEEDRPQRMVLALFFLLLKELEKVGRPEKHLAIVLPLVCCPHARSKYGWRAAVGMS